MMVFLCIPESPLICIWFHKLNLHKVDNMILLYVSAVIRNVLPIKGLMLMFLVERYTRRAALQKEVNSYLYNFSYKW